MQFANDSVRLFSLLACLAFGACGGSSQSPAPFGPELVEGKYRFIHLESISDDAYAATGVYEPVGSELLPSNVYFASAGNTGPGTAAFPVPFNVLPDRTFTLINDEWRGRITPDGMLATAVSTSTDTDSVLTVLVRHQEAPLLSSLAGEWKMISVGRSAPAQFTSVASVGDATIDASGELNFSQITTNFDGQIDPLPVALTPSQFVVLAAGELALQTAGAVSQRGGVSQDGNVILLAGHLITGVPAIRVLVRKGTASPTDFSGNYWSAALEFAPQAPRAWWGVTDRVAPSGDAFAQTYFFNAGVPAGPAVVTYQVGVLPNGELTFVLGGVPIPVLYRGMVAAGGAYAFLGGGISPSSGRRFTALVR